jgi:hypothetical protein
MLCPSLAPIPYSSLPAPADVACLVMQPGLSIVLERMLGFDGNEFYLKVSGRPREGVRLSPVSISPNCPGLGLTIIRCTFTPHHDHFRHDYDVIFHLCRSGRA